MDYAFAYLVVVGAMVIILKYFLGCLSRCTRIEADSAGSTPTSVVGSGWHERCHPTRLMRRRLDFRSSRYRSLVTSSTRRNVYPDSAGVTYALHITVCANGLCNKPLMLLILWQCRKYLLPPTIFLVTNRCNTCYQLEPLPSQRNFAWICVLKPICIIFDTSAALQQSIH